MDLARKSLVVAIVLIGLVAPATGSAHGAHKRSYKARYSGSGTYAVDLVSPTGEVGRVRADFEWDVAFKPASKRGRGVDFTPDPKRSSGSGSWSMTSEADGCSRSGDLSYLPGAGGLIDFSRASADVLFFPSEGDYSSTDPGNAGTPCDTDDFWTQWITGFSQIGGNDAVDPLTSFFNAPQRKLKHGRVSVATSNTDRTFPSLSPTPDCGFGSPLGGTCSQSFRWKGRVTIKPDSG